MTVTIINGGTQGLGEAVARKLTTSGATGLVLVGRTVDRGNSLAEELTSLGTPTLFVAGDVADPLVPRAVVAQTVSRFGGVDGLVNVAATTTRATVFTDTVEHFDRMMAINVRAPYFFIQAVATAMVESGRGGSIVNVGSTASYGGAPKLTAYSMSKGALNTMTRNLAFALMRHRIRVNQVNPGWMDTESEHHIQLTEDGAPENWLELAEAQRPLGRLVKPWEVANTIAYCLSADSGMMTGNLIDIEQYARGAGDGPYPTAAETPVVP
jgi:NAD(P)-dependent dehydrogenase (short-subunit alcohol dehydrogenase family)